VGCGRGTVWKLRRVITEGAVIRSRIGPDSSCIDTGYGSIEAPKVIEGYLNRGITARKKPVALEKTSMAEMSCKTPSFGHTAGIALIETTRRFESRKVFTWHPKSLITVHRHPLRLPTQLSLCGRTDWPAPTGSVAVLLQRQQLLSSECLVVDLACRLDEIL